jgi:hypothetical protein
MVTDNLLLRKLLAAAGDKLAGLLMTRYKISSVVITHDRCVENWAKLLGEVVVTAPPLDRITAVIC